MYMLNKEKGVSKANEAFEDSMFGKKNGDKINHYDIVDDIDKYAVFKKYYSNANKLKDADINRFISNKYIKIANLPNNIEKDIDENILDVILKRISKMILSIYNLKIYLDKDDNDEDYLKIEVKNYL